MKGKNNTEFQTSLEGVLFNNVIIKKIGKYSHPFEVVGL
jgi:hypothetical protein